jgi:hypothetical protein
MSEEISVKESNLKSVKYTFTNAPDYKVIYVNGVYGGNTTKGELCFDFFREFRPFPDEEIRELDADGRILPQETKDLPEQVEFIRERKIGIVMTVGFARSLYEWLGDKLSDFESMQSEFHQIISQSEGGDEDENE